MSISANQPVCALAAATGSPYRQTRRR